MTGLRALVDDPELLRMMIADQDRTGDSRYRPGPYWRNYQRRAVHAIENHGIGAFRSRADIGKGFSDAVVMDAEDLWADRTSLKYRAKKTLMRLPYLAALLDDYRTLVKSHVAGNEVYVNGYYRLLLSDWLEALEERFDLPETRHGGCGHAVPINGQKYTPLYLDLWIRIQNFAAVRDFTSLRSIFEIGGGFGSLPHSILTMYPNVKKVVYLDIPPMLYLGTQYLKAFFGDAVRDYRNTRDLASLTFADDGSVEILCICPWQIEKLDVHVDLFWNTASFSEMSKEIVRHYASHVTRCMSTEDPTICFIPSKLEPDSRFDLPMPEDIVSAFGDSYAFDKIAPALAHERASSYFVGRAIPSRQNG